MEVTRKNFNETLPLVTASIDKADFLVIDAEFTGLINGRDVSVFDSPEEYYTRLLNGSTEFLLIQYGLCAFYWDDENKSYLNDAYNFYVFPRGRPGPEKLFLCQSSSLDFLAAQGFDFNKLIKEGISYMTEPVETRLRECLTERQKSYSNEKESIIIPAEHKTQIEDICKKVREFLDESESEEMEIDRCNAFIRRLLFQELGTRFKNQAFIETKVLENKNRVLKVTRITSETDSKDRDIQKKEKEWEELEEAVGFSKVARIISQSGKLVIGHNMLLDVLHTLNHFFQPLPSDYSSFKEFAHCMFPRLLDTKYMSSLPPFKDKVNSTVLQHLFVTLSEPPFSIPKAESEDGRGYNHAHDKHHEAGFDAYLTGLCFLAMHKHLSHMRGEEHARVSQDSVILKPFLNKLYLAKTAHQDSPYMNLAGVEPTPSRDHVFHLTFPKDWLRNDINQLFSPFGPVTVQFLDDTSAYIGLSRREQARDVARALSKNARVALVPYMRHKNAANKAALQSQSIREHPTRDYRENTVDSKQKQANATNLSSVKKSPEVVSRVRTSSVTSPAREQETREGRKRTSSGMFQVDEPSEPPPKKVDLVRSHSAEFRKKPEVETRKKTEVESRKKPETVSNGRRRITGPDGDEKPKGKEKKVVDTFDKEAKAKCVSAFKESDTWD